MTDERKVQDERLGALRVRLKTGEYDGTDIMAAWIAIDELIELRAQVAQAEPPQPLLCANCGKTMAEHDRLAQCETAEIPSILFDGYAVFTALSEKAQQRTSAENVADTLDAVVRLLRAAPPCAETDRLAQWQPVMQALLTELTESCDREDFMPDEAAKALREAGELLAAAPESEGRKP